MNAMNACMNACISMTYKSSPKACILRQTYLSGQQWTHMNIWSDSIKHRQKICIRGIPVRMYIQALCETQVKSFQSQSQLVRNRKRQFALKCARTCAHVDPPICVGMRIWRVNLNWISLQTYMCTPQAYDVWMQNMSTCIPGMLSSHNVHTMHAVIAQHTYHACCHRTTYIPGMVSETAPSLNWALNCSAISLGNLPHECKGVRRIYFVCYMHACM